MLVVVATTGEDTDGVVDDEIGVTEVGVTVELALGVVVMVVLSPADVLFY